MAQVFGITHTHVSEAVLGGVTLSAAQQSRVTAAIEQYAAQASVHLRARGYDADAVYALGSTDDLYTTVARLILCRAAAEAARQFSQTDPLRATQLDEEADRIERMLRHLPEALTPTWDPARQQGAFRSYSGAPRVRRTAPRSRWSRDQST